MTHPRPRSLIPPPTTQVKKKTTKTPLIFFDRSLNHFDITYGQMEYKSQVACVPRHYFRAHNSGVELFLSSFVVVVVIMLIFKKRER